MRSEPENSDNLMHDLSDGSIFKEHPFFSSNSTHGLQIVSYYDEVETCNPLGSSSEKFKLGCVFFTLGNIRPQLRSGLKAIFLVLVAKSTIIKENGIDCVLKPFRDDLKTLYDDGIQIRLKERKKYGRVHYLRFLQTTLLLMN